MKTTRTLTWTATIMAALCILAPAIAPAADIAWTNISGGNWSVAANWNPNQVPGSADTVLITASGTYTVILDASATVAGLTLGSVNGIQTLTNSAGSLTLNNSSFVNTNGVLVLAGSGTKNLYGVLTNAGIIQMTGSGALYCYGGSGAGKLINLAGGLVDIQSDVSITSYGYISEAIVNQGTVRKSGGTGTNTIAPIFNNTGTLDVQTGTVSLNGGGSGNGQFSAAAGATILFSSSYTVNSGSQFMGAGTNLWSGGTITLNGSVTSSNAILAGATLAGTNGILSGLMTWTSGTMGNGGISPIATNGVLGLAGSAQKNLYGTITNRGIIPMTGSGALYCYGGSGAGKLINLAGGLVDIQSDVSITSSGYSSEAIVNQGTVRKSGGTGTNTIAPIFNNTGPT